MALYYNLVFGFLVFEMGFFTILSLPFPRKLRKTVLKTASAPFKNEQFQIALKCIIGFILVLFVDSVNRVSSVNAELKNLTDGQGTHNVAFTDRSEIQARRFFAQRNMYLCGFTLFLTLILTRTYSLVAELVVTKDKLDHVKLTTDTKTPVENEEITSLRKQLAEKDEDLEILKEQASSLAKEYDEVSGSAPKK